MNSARLKQFSFRITAHVWPSKRDTSCVQFNKQRMRNLWLADEITKIGSWTCRRCLRCRQRSNLGTSSLSTTSVQRASQIKRGSSDSAILKDPTLRRSTLISFPFKKPILKDSTWKPKSVKRGVIVAILTFASMWAFSDDAKHGYMAVTRGFRVFNALVRCLREYALFSTVSHV